MVLGTIVDVIIAALIAAIYVGFDFNFKKNQLI